MKLIEAISIILKEWDVQQKEQLGKDLGSIKKVYPLKSNPGYIVKTFPVKFKSYVQREEQFAKKYPNLYASIEKINYKKGWMIQEKLNTKKFLDELYSTTGFIKEIFKNKEDANLTKMRWIERMKNESDDRLQLFINYDLSARLWKFPSIEELFPSNSFAIKLLNFVHEVQKVQDSNREFDLHQFNIGFDWEGNIKLLDI